MLFLAHLVVEVAMLMTTMTMHAACTGVVMFLLSGQLLRLVALVAVAFPLASD